MARKPAPTYTPIVAAPPAPAGGLCRDGAMTLAAAAAFSGLSRRGIYRLMATGELAWLRVGGRRLIPKAALVALLDAKVVVRE